MSVNLSRKRRTHRELALLRKPIRPRNRDELRRWINLYTHLDLPERSVCPHHHSPLDYLEHSFFERHPADAVIWACRGGGKTMIGAVATLLDLVFKPPVQIRILGGSFEQAEKMYGYLRRLLDAGAFRGALQDVPTRRRLLLRNGSAVEVLAQSERAIRGQRVQKLRCDEVELFDPDVWSAAQLATRSLRCDETPAGPVAGAVEAFSTMHRPGGLMQQLLGDAARRRIFRWCVWDVVAQCHPQRDCAACPLADDCGGRAREARGFVAVDDLIAMKGRVSRATWEHEMLCRPPRFEDAVFPTFRRETHLRAATPELRRARPGDALLLDGRPLRCETLIAGVDYGYKHAFACLWIMLLRDAAHRRVAWVIDEQIVSGRTLGRNIADLLAVGRPQIVYADHAGRACNSQTGRSDEQVLRDAGLAVRSASMPIEEGLEVIRDLLDPACGPPRLLIDPRCAALIAAFEGYRNDAKGKPLKDGIHDHPLDALRYALANHDRPGTIIEQRFF